MEQFKQILKRLFFLPPLATVLIALPSFAFVIYVLSMGIDGAAAWLSYGLSSYALVITVTGAARAIRGGLNSSLVQKIRDHPLGKRYLTDVAFRTELSLYQGFFINLLYIVMKMASGIYYHSAWFVTLSIYLFCWRSCDFCCSAVSIGKPSGTTCLLNGGAAVSAESYCC